MFSAFRSRCTTSLSWMNFNPAAVCLVTLFTTSWKSRQFCGTTFRPTRFDHLTFGAWSIYLKALSTCIMHPFVCISWLTCKLVLYCVCLYYIRVHWALCLDVNQRLCLCPTYPCADPSHGLLWQTVLAILDVTSQLTCAQLPIKLVTCWDLSALGKNKGFHILDSSAEQLP